MTTIDGLDIHFISRPLASSVPLDAPVELEVIFEVDS